MDEWESDLNVSSGVQKKQGYHHNDLQNALQDVALEFIAERNGPLFSLRELAAAIGVSHASVYRHFKDKAALLEALTVKGFEMLHRYQEIEQAKAGSDSVSQLHALNDAYIRFASEKPGAFWLMFGNQAERETAAKERDRINAAALKTLTDAIERCQREGIIIPGDPQRIAGYLVMAPHGFACYSARDRAMIGMTEEVMKARTLAEIALIPVLTNPPRPHEIMARYFSE